MELHEGSLIDRMGGAEAASGFLVSSVEILYANLYRTSICRTFLRAVLLSKQVSFLAYVFGGPHKHKGRAIAEAHRHFLLEKGLNEAHFDIVTDHFKETLS